jgi:anti-sigma B factor antagonist
MTLNCLRQNEAFVIQIDGDLDAVSAIDLDTCLEDAVKKGEKVLIVDCTNLAYISSPGIGVFTSRLSDAQDGSFSIALCCLSEKISGVFSILGLDAIIPIYATLEEALNKTVHGV